MKLEYNLTTENGKLIFPDATRKRMLREVSIYLRDKDVTLTIEERKKVRSNNLNRYYWGVLLRHLVAIIKEMNPDLQVDIYLAHDWAKERFLPLVKDWTTTTIKTPDGEKTVVKTTTRLTNHEFMTYKELIQQWGAEWGWDIPDPNEDFEQQFIDIDKQ